tara:strand:- start:543 stop:1463 length:921 start_codon:yes stop_codon:yes gene_type:complete
MLSDLEVKMIAKIDELQKKFFIFLSFIAFILYFLFNSYNSLNLQIYFLFFLVSIIGIPHGFFDFSIGKILFKKYLRLWPLYFVITYMVIFIAYLISWLFLPGLSLLFFLFLAAYHFGFEDYNYLNNENEKYFNVSIFIKGLIVVFTPILFHFDDINYLFKLLIGYKIEGVEFSSLQKLMFVFLSIFHILFERKKSFLHKFEGIISFANFVFLPPLLSFILYFCFMHSIRHFIESIYVSRLLPENFTIKRFLIYITISSFIFSLLSIFLIKNIYEISINETIIKFIFIILACLTLPHMIFNMWPSKK